jgi:hypothetical protein
MSLLFQSAKIDLEEHLLEIFLLYDLLHPVALTLGALSVMVVPRGRI